MDREKNYVINVKSDICYLSMRKQNYEMVEQPSTEKKYEQTDIEIERYFCMYNIMYICWHLNL